MPNLENGVQLFNLKTMSGVFPGTHTQIFQRLRIGKWPVVDQTTAWAQALWYADPAACVVTLPGDADEQQAEPTLLRLLDPLSENFNQRVQTALQGVGWQLQSCGSCRFWQPDQAQTSDNLPTGLCGWPSETIAVPVMLATQSVLALDCSHWQTNSGNWTAAQAMPIGQALQPLLKAAEVSESKLPFWQRLTRPMLRLGRPRTSPTRWEEKLIERSGVGAGTEACFACQGRIANLGALAVETPEGDKQTFSIWRCRTCYTTYCNDWIDRWERLDNLETEERYYRIAPAEALTLLRLIDNVVGGDHPGRRRERNPQRGQILHFLAERTPLSHQIKQGR